MFILIFFLVMSISGFATNKMLGVADDSSDAYEYSRKDSLIIIVLFALSIILQVVLSMTNFFDNYFWYIVLGYGLLILITMILLSQLRKVSIQG